MLDCSLRLQAQSNFQLSSQLAKVTNFLKGTVKMQNFSVNILTNLRKMFSRPFVK